MLEKREMTAKAQDAENTVEADAESLREDAMTALDERFGHVRRKYDGTNVTSPDTADNADFTVSRVATFSSSPSEAPLEPVSSLESDQA